MSTDALIWLLCNFISIVILAFYSMSEMACVSFNKVRLQYYVTKGNQRAIWLNDLLQNPSRLFGTTLIGVNFALVVGSECAREFYSSIGLDPDIAPLTQVLLVVIFGELAPMFAARHYPEHVAMLGIPLLYTSAKIMTPLLWLVDMTSKICNYFIGGNKNEANLYLTQEELQKILEEQNEEDPLDRNNVEFNAITTNIFTLRGKTVTQIMEPLNKIASLPSKATVKDMEVLLSKNNASYVPIYKDTPSNIIAIAYPRDLIRANSTQRVRDYAKPPWFISEMTTMVQTLKQFRTNSESVAIILDSAGKAIGIMQLDDILEEIFGKFSYTGNPRTKKHLQLVLIDKTVAGNMTVGEFNSQFDVLLNHDPTTTLGKLFITHLDHPPQKGESIYIAPFILTVKELSLSDVKTISVSTSR